MQYDKIYCINLDKRTDKWEEFQRDVLEGLELDKGKFERISAIDGSGIKKRPGGAIGCAASHLKIWKDMIDSGYNSVLIFEDDFMPVVTKEEFHTTLDKLYKKHPSFNACCLAWNTTNKTVFLQRDDTFTTANDILTTSCYIITKDLAKLMYNHISIGIINMMHGENKCLNAIDVLWHKFQNADWLISSNRLGIQRPGYSDVCNSYQDYGGV